MKLDHVLRSAMGWDHSRAHSFQNADGSRYDESDAVLADVLAPERELVYTYDRGWRHRITFELATIARAARDYPYCADGAGTCPYEDIGGPAEWAALMAAPADHVDRLLSVFEVPASLGLNVAKIMVAASVLLLWVRRLWAWWILVVAQGAAMPLLVVLPVSRFHLPSVSL